MPIMTISRNQPFESNNEWNINRKLDKMIFDMEIANQNMRAANAINERTITRAGQILIEMKYNPDHMVTEMEQGEIVVGFSSIESFFDKGRKTK